LARTGGAERTEISFDVEWKCLIETKSFGLSVF